MIRMTLCFLISLMLLYEAAPLRGDDLNAPLEKIEGGPPDRMMRRYLLRQVDAASERWRAEYENRKTPEQIAAYQKRLRKKLLEVIGGLPERTPLEPQTVGVVSRPGYRVEKIIYQSQPKHYVTALLFLPDPEKFKLPRPGVLMQCGHNPVGKSKPEYQGMAALLALNGMVSLVFDPIDQGERGQYLGRGGWPGLRGTTGHTMIGMGCVALGRNTARYMIWDAMRAVDYLQSRPEVDPHRIGCTGNSGGGTQTSYLMALDDRIAAAAPCCYLTSLPKLLATVGPQDAEQNLFGQLAFGLDHADWIMLWAPSPVLIAAVTRDAFDIGGTWDSFRCAKRLYTRLGFAERVDLVEDDGKHGLSLSLREGVARWMARWLLDENRVIVEPQINLLTEQEWSCVANNKAMTLPEARSVYDLNEDYENELAKRRAKAWATGDRETLLREVRRIAGIRRLSELPEPQIESLGSVARNGYQIEKLLIKPEEGISLPALWFLPEKTQPNGVVLYVHQKGKAADAGPGGPIEQLVQAGQCVLAVDLRGTGQTQAKLSTSYYSNEYQDAYMAYLLGRSYVGMRAEDVLVCARYAAGRFSDGPEASVRLIAVGNVGVPALHAAALEPNLFQHVALWRSLVSWSNVVHNRLNKSLTTHLVHGALVHYDLPDLATTLDGKIVIEQPVNAVGAVLQ